MKISDAEWRLMRVVWRRRAATAAQVIEELASETGWSHRTVRTLLGRLVKKGALEPEEEGNRYVYRPKVSQLRCVRQEARSFVDKVFDGDAAELLIHFVRNEAISPEHIDELKRLLEKRGKEENE
jgi:BlaI family penicillinase repressor